ncbi:BAG domain-containing protein Samui isoform X2 [Condylostylus longicornis]|uniref:BAG domain-containing protein Samui isoform X2 n=1 Tax=Condylostylus longicornis TaxID=2530218 RepID=UPI00244DF6CA|nr:BAG domain-containing protein Samui isoform X2 [Condylostylus longicornis]
MKPSVISNGNGSGNPQTQQQHPSAAGINAGVNSGTNTIPHQQQDTSGYPHNVRGQFPSGFSQGFGFDPDMDDIFSDTRMRSRLPRMRDPFGTFGTHGADDFFSGFGRRRNPHDFFDFPEEFRQYIPDGFGIPRSGSGGISRAHQVHPTYQQQPQSNDHPINTAQYAPPSPQYDNVPQSPKPNLCDASIQTDEDLPDGPNADNQQQIKSSSGPKLNKKFSQENEENRGPRSQSAPPHQNEEIAQQQQQQQQQPGEEPVYVTSASFSSSAPQSQGKFPKTKSQGSGGIPPQPPQRQQQQPFYLHNQGQTRQWPPPPQPPSPQQTYPPEPQTPGGTVIRTIPIFVEGRKDPIINEHKEIPGQTTPVQQQQQPPQFPQPQYQQTQNQAPQYAKPPAYQKHAYATPPKSGAAQPQQQPFQQSPPQQNAQPQKQFQSQNKAHPTVDTHQPMPEGSDVPPQTPQTMDCINKIQNIQRDVLHLMEQVEAFGGLKSDKEYMYLDEMLTRNLLKLDTIDTNGKESIRLARKEAIKCIQASINVLEAKADENARRTGKFEVRHNSIEEDPAAEEKEQNVDKEENLNVLNDQTVIPLPPPPDHKEDKSITDVELKKSNSSISKSASVTKSPSISKSGSQASADKQIINENEKIQEQSNEVVETQNSTEKVPSKSKIPARKSSSPTKETTDETNREKSRSQSKSPSKSPTKLAAKEGAKKKIIKKIKKLTKKDSKEGDEDDNEKSKNTNDKIDVSANSNEETVKTTVTTEEQPPATETSEKKE